MHEKHFGAGMARKAGMDIALSRLYSVGNINGIIISLDADSLVLPNYFNVIYDWFQDAEKTGATIYFEHPLDGNEFPPEVYKGIIKYELHLRYYLQAWRETGFSYAYHALGSAIAIRAYIYAIIGGMSRKQAGEDFYFLQKLIPLGFFGEINKTKVIPSPRPSDRVIFGTGAAIANHLKGTQSLNITYNYHAFADLKKLFALRSQLFDLKLSDFELWTQKLPALVQLFLHNTNFLTDLTSLKNNCATPDVFNKRFLVFVPRDAQRRDFVVKHIANFARACEFVFERVKRGAEFTGGFHVFNLVNQRAPPFEYDLIFGFLLLKKRAFVCNVDTCLVKQTR
jgi:hypothetical protein